MIPGLQTALEKVMIALAADGDVDSKRPISPRSNRKCRASEGFNSNPGNIPFRDSKLTWLLQDSLPVFMGIQYFYCMLYTVF